MLPYAATALIELACLRATFKTLGEGRLGFFVDLGAHVRPRQAGGAVLKVLLMRMEIFEDHNGCV